MQLSSLVRPQRLPSLLLSRSLGTASCDPFSVLRADTGADPMLNRKLGCQGFGASVAAMTSFPPQRYHYFLVLDFEATCDKPQIHPQEIIEFPILKLNGRTMEIESTFHTYVQPVVHPQLTPFCTELTGIIQEMVDGQPTLSQVLERVDEWMAKEGLLDPSVKSIFVTCGDWDLKLMLPGQCEYLGLQVADYFKQWINLKKAYSFAIGTWPKNGLLDMNKGMSLQHIGRPHSGIVCGCHQNRTREMMETRRPVCSHPLCSGSYMYTSCHLSLLDSTPCGSVTPAQLHCCLDFRLLLTSSEAAAVTPVTPVLYTAALPRDLFKLQIKQLQTYC
ncbi:ERI1 exoribonuclease 3 [Dendrobates tinctorius]|uniref:ERI1 exoribonuclease 3 n=1 Tax=Dendrobates tinctorius TaxID=92724 RepID=UPI003CC9A180